MSDNKLIFFDIDGTIWDHNNVIPKSALKAFEMLKARGHKIFLCSGRARGYIKNENLLSIGFDGIVSGCGTRLEYDDKVIFEHNINPETMAYIIDTVRSYGMRPILEGSKRLYLDLSEWEGDPYYQKLYRDLKDDIWGISDHHMDWPDVNKLSCDTTSTEIEKCEKELSDILEFIMHSKFVVEMVPKGFSKGSGITKMTEYLGCDMKDTYAFGDSVNDTHMIKTAGCGVVMGNGPDDLKAIADYVTTPMKEDGIYNACMHLGLIK